MTRLARPALFHYCRQSSLRAKILRRVYEGRAQAGFARRSEVGCGEVRAAASRLPALCLALAACAQRVGSEPPQQAQLARAVAAPSRLKLPDDLPGPARAILKQRMASHVRDMSDLVAAIMILDYERVRERARMVADDVNLSRPLTDDATELNALLPEKFFLYQDETRSKARALEVAARRMSAFDVADAYGALVETCVRCHATYRGGR